MQLGTDVTCTALGLSSNSSISKKEARQKVVSCPSSHVKSCILSMFNKKSGSQTKKDLVRRESGPTLFFLKNTLKKIG